MNTRFPILLTLLAGMSPAWAQTAASQAGTEPGPALQLSIPKEKSYGKPGNWLSRPESQAEINLRTKPETSASDNTPVRMPFGSGFEARQRAAEALMSSQGARLGVGAGVGAGRGGRGR